MGQSVSNQQKFQSFLLERTRLASSLTRASRRIRIKLIHAKKVNDTILDNNIKKINPVA